ncbi:MAG: SDR family oxidoreductase [Rhizobiales bacterium]|nr:SDR family oxidoreductase [Hyphomicrobiales bacterium]
MATLVCFGFGYCAEHFIAEFGGKFERIIGTVRRAERAGILNAYQPGAVRAVVFDGVEATPELHSAIDAADYALICTPPDAGGDPVLAACGSALAARSNLHSVVYLSTVGVYGDHGGGWVDEQTQVAPRSERSRWRVAAEQAWQQFGARHGVPVAILRLAGIYGPGQNALVTLARGKARRIVKPGQVFNRIHVADIAQAIGEAFARRASGVFNIADDEPSPPADPIVFAAELMHRDPPPEIPFAQAAPSMSEMGLSFWQECRRVRNAKLKRELGVTLRYPTYREGLQTLFAEINAGSGL